MTPVELAWPPARSWGGGAVLFLVGPGFPAALVVRAALPGF